MSAFVVGAVPGEGSQIEIGPMKRSTFRAFFSFFFLLSNMNLVVRILFILFLTGWLALYKRPFIGSYLSRKEGVPCRQRELSLFNDLRAGMEFRKKKDGDGS